MASGCGGPGGAGISRRLRGPPGLSCGSKRSLFKGRTDRSDVSSTGSRGPSGFLRRLFGRPPSTPTTPPAPSAARPRPDVAVPSADAVPATSPSPPGGGRGPSTAAASAPPISGIASGSCPKCHVPYLPAGTTGRWGCPFCGRHATTVGKPASGPTTAASAPRRPMDRRHEELLAAWMMGGPLPCPRCRGPLRHATGGVFSCAGCGERTELDELVPSELGRPHRAGEQRPVAQGGHQAVQVRS